MIGVYQHSLTEIETGQVWMNGEPIYTKTYNCGAVSDFTTDIPIGYSLVQQPIMFRKLDPSEYVLIGEYITLTRGATYYELATGTDNLGVWLTVFYIKDTIT